MRVAIGSDHAGFDLKQTIKALLDRLRIPCEDAGTASTDSADYPDVAEAVAGAVLGGRADRGILICGTGIGMSIAANKIPGIRAALAWDEASAVLGRAHNDAQHHGHGRAHHPVRQRRGHGARVPDHRV